jgi:hypothetical protein
MSRALNRHYDAVAKARRTRILAANYFGWHCERPWRDFSKLLMNEPGRWIREMMTRPARGRANQLCRLVTLGRDADEWRWPDGKKPHLYYW